MIDLLEKNYTISMSGYLISDEILLGRFKVIRILTYIYIILRMNMYF